MEKEMYKELESEFDGIGEVRGYHFYQLQSNGYAYLYELTDEEGRKHYEVFEHRANTQFGNISYPKSKAFGVWAWCLNSLEKAVIKYKEITERISKRKSNDYNI